MMQTSPNPAIISATPINHAPAKCATEAPKDATEEFAMLVDAPDQIEANPRSTPRRIPEGFELRTAEVSIDVSGGPATPNKIVDFGRLDEIALEPEAMDSSTTALDSRPAKSEAMEPLWIILDANIKPSLPTSNRQQTVPLPTAFHSKAIAVVGNAGSPLKDQSQLPPIVGPGLAPVPGDSETSRPGKFSLLTDLSTGHAAAHRAEPVASRFNKTIANAELNRSTVGVSALLGADQLSSTFQQQIVPTTTHYSEGDDQTSSRQDKPETPDKSATAPSHVRSSENSIETALVTVAEPSTLPPRPVFHQVARALAETVAAPPGPAAPASPTLQARQITIELKPEGLGRIVATLTSIAGQLHVHLRPDSEPVALQLEADMGSLGQALVAAGVTVSDISISPAVNAEPSTINASAHDATAGSGARGEEARTQGRGDNRGEFTKHRRGTSRDGTQADIATKTDHYYLV